MNTCTTNTFSADVEINEVIVDNVLNEQFRLKSNTIKLLSEGFDNAVYLINHHLVFRFPRRARSVDLILREVNLLPKLEKLLSVKNIRLLDEPVDDHDISCKIPGFGSLYLKCSVVKKTNQ